MSDRQGISVGLLAASQYCTAGAVLLVVLGAVDLWRWWERREGQARAFRAGLITYAEVENVPVAGPCFVGAGAAAALLGAALLSSACRGGGAPACPRCGAGAPGEARFCRECGAELARPRCPACGAARDPRGRFCAGCGAPANGSKQ